MSVADGGVNRLCRLLGASLETVHNSVADYWQIFGRLTSVCLPETQSSCRRRPCLASQLLQAMGLCLSSELRPAAAAQPTSQLVQESPVEDSHMCIPLLVCRR